MDLNLKELKDFLEEKHDVYNRPRFIETDPVSIPHRYTAKEDIEIAGFLSAIIAWGQRKTILRNANFLMELMNHAPHEFVMNASPVEINKLGTFIHRTFNGDDCKYFIRALRNIYMKHGGLEGIFGGDDKVMNPVEKGLVRLRKVFFEIEHPRGTEKHIADITRGASGKRLNMFLRWMVRRDNRGVDFGIWKTVPSSRLFIPLDIHTGNVSRKLGLLERKQNDWKAVVELTGKLRKMEPDDPVKYDFALFGLGIFEKF